MDGSIVEGLRTSGGGIDSCGNNPGGKGGVSRSRVAPHDSIGNVTGNYVSGMVGGGIEVGPGSTVIGNTSINNGGFGITADCPANLTDNTSINNHPNLVLNGKGCLNKDNVAPKAGDQQ
jgi:hypothetical protein